jgi:hypothetical protein
MYLTLAYIFFFLLTNGLSSNLKMFNTLAIYQIILHLNKITECLKMTTFKIVFTLDVFFSAMRAKRLRGRTGLGVKRPGTLLNHTFCNAKNLLHL